MLRFNPVAGSVFLCGIMILALTVNAWRQRAIAGALLFSLSMASLAVYILGYSLELASLDLPTMLFWNKAQHLGVETFPTLLLLFVFQYIGREKWLTRRNIILLFTIPVLILAAKITDDRFHLIYSQAALDTSGLIPLLSVTRGPLYLFGAVYALLPVLAGILLLWQKRRHASDLYRSQVTLIAVSAMLPLAVYCVYLIGFQPVPSLKNLDLNVFTYTVLGMGMSWGMFRYGLFDLAPVAREALIDHLSDGVIVLDEQHRVVDANLAVQNLFGWAKPPFGQPADQLLSGWIDLPTLLPLKEPVNAEIHFGSGDQDLFFEVGVSILRDKKGRLLSYLILFHDITERKRSEEKLRELSLVDELTDLNNRRGFKMLATQLIQMADRMDLTAALLYIDLDGLKWINDTLGHPAGDRALMDTASILKSTFRSSDILARLGGDEFVVVAIESGDNSGEAMLMRLMENLEAHNQQPDREYRLSISVGMAYYCPGCSGSLEGLLEGADRAMYDQKQAKKLQITA